MNVTEISLQNFLSHGSSTLKLPKRGVVVITGPNGAGKSSFVEAVAFAMWGKTLRGTTPWRDGFAGSVSVVSDLLSVAREVSAKGSAKLAWGVTDDRASWIGFDTQKKAADSLADQVGDIDLWRRTHVFSSQDAAHFTLATDGERKRLLETLLGLDRFDLAFNKASEDRKQVKTRVDAAQIEVAKAKQRFDFARESLRTFDLELVESEPTQPAAVDAADIQAAHSRLRVLEVEQQDLYTQLMSKSVPDDLLREVSKLEAELAAVKKEQAFVSAGNCPTCSRPLDVAHSADLSSKVEWLEMVGRDARALLHQKRREVDEERMVLDLTIRNNVAEQRAVNATIHRLNQQKEQFDAWKAAHNSWAQRQSARVSKRSAILKSISVAEDLFGNAEDALAAVQAELAVLNAVVAVFGLKGVRAHVLGKALGGIEQIANAWLQRIARTPLRLELKPYKDLKSGGTQDAISLEVTGAGGGYGYRASSGGERRRIDAALLLALAEVAAAAYGKHPGTVFVDEVFDALDADGIEAVAEALAELAFDRCVVVITHDELLARKIPAVQRVRVEAGTVV